MGDILGFTPKAPTEAPPSGDLIRVLLREAIERRAMQDGVRPVDLQNSVAAALALLYDLNTTRPEEAPIGESDRVRAARALTVSPYVGQIVALANVLGAFCTEFGRLMSQPPTED